MSAGREITLIEEDDGWWSAVDEEAGVASQGASREEALENLDDAVALTMEALADDTPAPTPAPRGLGANSGGFAGLFRRRDC